MKLFIKPTITTILIFLFFCQTLTAQQLAFPTAMGAGAYSTGGRGGAVVHVTNLNDSGVGSLRWALQDVSNRNVSRTIVFDVSGVIELQSNIYLDNNLPGNGAYAHGITIAGQTAPEGNITITGGKIFLVGIDDVIVRYLKFRSTANVSGCLQVQDGNDTILDHLTGSHVESSEITFSVTANREVNEGLTTGKTVQNCLIHNSGLGLIIGDSSPPNDTHNEEYTVINNLFVDIGWRAPAKIGSAVRMDVINNTVHNHFGRLIRIDDWSYTLNHIGNYYSKGYNIGQLLNVAYFGTRNGLIYENDNYYDQDFVDLPWEEFLNSGNPVPASSFKDTAFSYNNPETISVKPNSNLKTEVLPYVGAYKYINDSGVVLEGRDAFDTEAINKAINEVNNGSGNDYDLIVSEIPTQNNSRPVDFYGINRHIPQAYLTSQGIPNTLTVHNDIAPSGYTILEEYLNQVDTPNIAIGVESVVVSPNTHDLTVQETTTLTATITPDNATNQSGVWESNDETIATVDSNGVVTAISPGIVTIRFTTNDGGFTDTSEITVFPEALQASAGSDQQICIGESTTLTASGGTSYVWNNGETTASIEVTLNETTTFTVTVSNDNGQSEDASVTINVNPLPIANAGEDQTICEGEIVTLTATGGDSYLWSTGETTESIEVNPTLETNYSVEVSSTNCSSTDDVTIFVNEAPEITITDDVVIVEGNSTTLTANGGDTYEWSTGDTTDTISVSPTITTTYTVSTIGVNGCSGNAEVTVTVIPGIIAEAGEDVTICSGDSTTLSASGGITYTWDTGATDSEIIVSPTETTTYTVTAEDDYGYTDTDTVTVFVNAIPNITVDEPVFIMIGSSTTLTANGGETYEWNTGETTTSITVNPNSTTLYTVTGFSENGCQSTAEVLVTVIEVLNANAGEDVAICLGESISLNASGGITYNWNTGAVGAYPVVSPTETTTYTVTVTDGFGNSDSDDVTVTVNPTPTAIASADQIICNGASATLSAEGGDTYLWNTGDTNSTITVNPNTNTTYTVEVFSNGCSDSDEVTVTVLPTPDVIISEDIVIITGNVTTLEVSGGDSYVWNTGETSNTIEVSPTETTSYSVTAFLNNGCQSTAQVTVTVIPQVNANAGDDVSICNGENVTLNATGGITYTWNTGGTGASPTFSPTETTTYTVTVTDEYGNSDSDSVTVTVNELPNITVSDDITINEGDATTLIANGGESYLWNTGESTSSINVAPAETTTYNVVGYSAIGCESEVEVTVTVIPELTANAGNDVAICSGESVTLNASGGLTYTWNTGDTGASPTFTPTITTTYTVTVTDSYGSSDSDSVTVTVNELPNVTVSDDITINEGDATTLIANGAESYLWNTGELTSSINVAPAETTTYNVIGYSALGCESEVEVTVTVIPELTANAGNDVTICSGESVTLNASGGLTYTWNTGDTGASPTFTPTITTTYTVTVTDSYGSSDSDSVTVTVNELPNVTVSEAITIIEGESTNLVVTGAETYLWSTGETSSTITVSPTQTTTYTVTGTTNTCTVEAQVTVTVEGIFVASAGEDKSVCDNETYEIVLTANQGDSYLWNTGEITQSITVSPLSTTTYSVTVTLGEQQDTDAVNVNVEPSPEVVIANGDSVDILNGDFITLSASGANTYEWNNGATQPNIAVSPSLTTTYEVKGYIGDCYDEKQVTVNVLQPVVANAGEDAFICLNDVTTLTASGGDEYEWNTGETTPTIEVSPTETTAYTVTVFNALDFDEATVTVEVDINCEEVAEVPIDDDSVFSFDIFPNPATDVVNVKLSSGALIVSYVHIYDLTGKLIQSTKISNEDLNPSTTRQIDISSLQTGVYFVKLIDMNRDVTKKLIVN